MPKQTLYEFLGVKPDATDDQISALCRLHRKIIDSHADAGDRRNQLVFLQHAEDTLLNADKRARYDQQLLQEAESATVIVHEGPMPTHSGSKTKTFMIALLVASAGAFAWERFSVHPTPVPVAPPPLQQDLAQAATETTIEVPPEMLATSPAAEPVGNGQGGTPASNDPVPAPVDQPKTVVTYTVQTTGPYAKLLNKLVWSVFAVIGPKSFGTGVLIDDEKLLTNCHTIAHNAGPGNKMYAINSVTHQRAEITKVAFMAYRGEDACLVIAPGLKGKPVELGDIYRLGPNSKVHNIGFVRGSLSSSDGNFAGFANINGQAFIQSTNYCDHGVSGGPLVDDDGGLVGLTTGGPSDRSKCFSLTIETAKRVLYEPTINVDEFPTNYASNIVRH